MTMQEREFEETPKMYEDARKMQKESGENAGAGVHPGLGK